MGFKNIKFYFFSEQGIAKQIIFFNFIKSLLELLLLLFLNFIYVAKLKLYFREKKR